MSIEYSKWQKVSPRHHFFWANEHRMYHIALRDGERPWVVDLTLIHPSVKPAFEMLKGENHRGVIYPTNEGGAPSGHSIIRVGDYATLYDAKRAVEARERSLGTIPTLTPDTKRLS